MAAAISLRRVLFRTVSVSGAAVLGIAYYQRLPGREDDHRSGLSRGLLTRVYRNFVAPLAFQTDPEFAHVSTVKAGELFQAGLLLLEPFSFRFGALDWLLRPSPSASSASSTAPSLAQDLFEGRLHFESPLGIAAGFDKNGVLVPLWRLGVMPGLGFSEVGSVSALPAPGNTKPRCWRLVRDESVMNFMGLNNDGAEVVAERFKGFASLGRADREPETGKRRPCPVGINIAKTHSPEITGEAAIQDFTTSFRKLAPEADFVVINVSCPNTAEGKTFEEPEALGTLLQAIKKERASISWEGPIPPVLVKLVAPPDTPEGKQRLQTLLKTVEGSGTIDGLVISNTMPYKEAKLSSEGQEKARDAGKGGLSGPPLHGRSVAAIKTAYEATGGRLPIIGVGGTDSAETAYAKIRAGASLIEVYTGLIFNGPGLLPDIQRGLKRLLERDGFSSLQDAVGADTAVRRKSAEVGLLAQLHANVPPPCS